MAQVKKDTKKEQVKPKKKTTNTSKKAKEVVQKTAKTTAKKVQGTAKKVKKTAQELDRDRVKDILLKQEMTREHKYIILALSSILIAFFIYTGVSFVLQNVGTVENTFEEIDLGTYEKISKSEEKEIVYIATKNSDLNREYEDILIEVARSRKTKVKFLDLGLIKERNQIIGFMNAIDLTKDTYIEPMLIIFENGTVKDSLFGASTKKELIHFLDKNRID